MSDPLIYALGVIAFVVGVAISIALHELGHLLPARAFGVKVTQYFVGFGNTIWSIKRGETEYGLKAIPLGGYVKLVGMLPPAKEADPHEVRVADTGLFSQLVNDARSAEYEHVTDADLNRLFYRKAWWKKVIVMSGGPLVNVVLAVLLFAIVLMGFGVEAPSTTVARVSDCAISDSEAGRACTDDDPITPAKAIGLQPGDRIIAFAGRSIDGWNDLTRAIRDHGDERVPLTYVRDGVETTVDVTPSVVARASLDEPERTERVGFLGIEPTKPVTRQDFGAVLDVMGHQTSATASAIVHLPERMVGVVKAAFGADRAADSPISVVGASRVAGELVTYDDPTWSERITRVLSLLAGLNLFLALFNAIPLLPLDGGHVAGALWEAARRGIARLRGRPDPGYVDVAKLLPVAYGVGALLIVMSVILIYADIVNPVRIS